MDDIFCVYACIFMQKSVFANTWVCMQVKAISQSLCPSLITTLVFLFFCFFVFPGQISSLEMKLAYQLGCLVNKFWDSSISASCWGCRSVPPLQATLQDWVLDQNQLFTLAQKIVSWLGFFPDFPFTVVFSMISMHPL